MNLKWLVWKDYRVNRLVFITALVLMIVPYGFAAVLLWRGLVTGPDVFLGSAIYALALLQLTLAFMGGNAIAGERVDRSAEFFSSLPVSRRRSLVSRLLVTLALVALIWLPNLLIIAAIGMPETVIEAVRREIPGIAWRIFGSIAVTGLTFFCVAWFFSSILDSPTFSVCAGLIVPLLVWLGILWTYESLRHASPYDGDLLLTWYAAISLTISAIAFPTGTLYYLRRVEP